MHKYQVTFNPYLFRENNYRGEIPPLEFSSNCKPNSKTFRKDLAFSILEYCSGNMILVEIANKSINKIIERK